MSQNLPDFTVDRIMQINDREFSLFQELIYRSFGVHLVEAKRSLLVQRLQSKVKSLGFTSFQQYYDLVNADRSGRELSEVVNRITTNYTYFYREPDHFTLFSNRVLPELEAKYQMGNRDLRVWCAAASTGEEPYMLSMLMMEYFGLDYRNWNAGVLATDISERALAKAIAGRYDLEQLKTLPSKYKTAYFRSIGEGVYEVSPELKRDVLYRRFNLINKIYPFKKKFDVIFCRNVMIYFDQPTKDKILDQFYDCLNLGGYLFVGHSESITRQKTAFSYIQPAVYQKR